MSTGSWGAQEPQGPGWYQASDGLWYPPAGAAGPAAPGGAPVVVDIEAPLEIDRWRPLVAWILVIPHVIVSFVVILIAYVCTVIAFFTVLFTKQIPVGIEDWMVRSYRYQWQITTYALWMREKYPDWAGQGGDVDPGVDPARLTIRRAEELNRWAPLYKWILAVPHYIVLTFLFIAAYVVIVIGWFAAIITGKWPEGMRKFVVGVFRWSFRVSAYVYFLRDEYPPFALD